MPVYQTPVNIPRSPGWDGYSTPVGWDAQPDQPVMIPKVQQSPPSIPALPVNINSDFSGTAPGTAGTALGALGTAKGAYDTYQGFQHGGAGMRTGLTEAGAGIGTMVAGPLGTVVGGAAGNVAGYGLQGKGLKNDAALAFLGPVGWGAIAAKHLGLLTPHETTAQYQENRDQKLLDQKGNVADFVTKRNQARPTSGNFKGKVDTSQAADFVGSGSNGWVNNKFAQSGNVADLVGNDVVGSDSMLEKFGQDYFGKYTTDQRSKLAQAAIDAKAVSLHKGDTKIDWTNPDLVAKVNQITAGPESPKKPIAIPRIVSPPTKTPSRK